VGTLLEEYCFDCFPETQLLLLSIAC